MRRLLNLSFFCAFAICSRAQTAKAVVFSSYYDLVDSLTAVKTTVEDYGTEMQFEWKNDSLKNLGETKYTKVRATMAGIIASFSEVIKDPKRMKKKADADKIRSNITNQLKKLYDDMNNLTSFYTNAKAYLVKGGKFGTITVVTSLFEAGIKVFEMIKDFNTKQKQEKADQFAKACGITPWAALKKLE